MLKFLRGAMLFMSMLVSVQMLAQEVQYYAKWGGLTEKAKAAYFEVVEPQEGLTAIGTRYTMDSVKVKTIHYKYSDQDRKSLKVHGLYQEWHKNGQLAVEGNYTNDKLNGSYTMWYETGELAYKRSYRNNTLQDTVQGFYKNGTLRRFEVYEQGKLVKGEIYTEKGKLIKPFYPYEQMPSFKGGEKAMFSFISSKVIYPKSAIEADISGIVYVTFVVNKDGKVSDIDILRGIHPDLDAETIRVVKAMPKWVPGTQEGEPVAVRFNMPMKFSLK